MTMMRWDTIGGSRSSTFGMRGLLLQMTSDSGSDSSEDREEEGPLEKGIDSVSWLPTVKDSPNTAVTSVQEGSTILPLFPLGGIVYTPNSEHTLNIFEPRYRQMYNDILMNGSKRFVVAMSHPTEAGQFAQVGVLFELEDLKEVSEQTNDQVKYICSHRVTGRVKLHRILNPTAWYNRDTYLKVEGTLMDADTAGTDTKQELKDEYMGDGDDEDIYTQIANRAKKVYETSAPVEEEALRLSFRDLVEMQHELEEDVRFTRASVKTLAVSPGDKDEGLWATIRLWQSYSEQRLVGRQNELQREFQDKLIAFLKKEKGLDDEELPSSINFQDLSADLQKEVQALQKRMTVELEPLVLESTLTMQKLLEAEDHRARLSLLKFFVDAERKRLEARKVLRGMFTGGSTTEDDSETESAASTKDTTSSSSSSSTIAEDAKTTPTETQSIFMDDEDAFQ